MTALNIDTHKFVRRLRNAGFEERQAEAIIDTLSKADTSQIATTVDLGNSPPNGVRTWGGRSSQRSARPSRWSLKLFP